MEGLEAAIVSLISQHPTLPAKTKVEAWPDGSIESGRGPLGSAVIRVLYVGVKLRSDSHSPGRSISHGPLYVDAYHFVKSLRTHASAYGLLRATQDALTAQRPDGLASGYDYQGGAGLAMVDERILSDGRQDGLWQWAQRFEVPVTYTKRIT